jgi:hypothetical protein
LDVHSSHGPLRSSGEPARRSCFGQGQGVGVEAVPELLREACEEGTSNSHHRVFCSVAIGSVPATSLFSLREPARDDLRATARCLRARSRRAGCFEPSPPRAVFCRDRFRTCDAFLLVSRTCGVALESSRERLARGVFWTWALHNCAAQGRVGGEGSVPAAHMERKKQPV